MTTTRTTKTAYAPGDLVRVIGEGEWLVVAGPSRHGVYALRKVYAYSADLSFVGLSCVTFERADRVHDHFGTYPVPAEDRETWGPSFEGWRADAAG